MPTLMPRWLLKVLKMVNEVAGQHQVHRRQISQWKRQVQGGAKDLLERVGGREYEWLKRLKRSFTSKLVA